MPNDTIYEFRDYELRPGQRDVLIELFEREFIDPQDALGAHVRATFRDLDNPDRFVWIRSFADAQVRYNALNGFYTGPVWQAHRDAARETMIDTDNVLQLRPFAGALPTSSTASEGTAGSLILATIYYPAASTDEAFARQFVEAAPQLLDLQAAPFATFVTDHASNSYPPLPVRDESVLLTLTRFASAEAYAAKQAAIVSIASDLARSFVKPIEFRRLQPTARSPLR